MSKTKFLDFSELGIQCICGKLGAYIACDKHEKYPILTKKHLVRVPVCSECTILCDDCKETTVTEFLEKLEVKQNKEKEKRKREKHFKTIRKEISRKQKKFIIQKNLPIIKRTDEDLLKTVNELSINDEKIAFFKQAAISNIDLIFAMDIGTQLGFEEINKKLKTYGITPNIKFDKNLPKINSLVLLLLMIRGFGLTKYEDDIMKAEIHKTFTPTIKDDADKLLKKIKAMKSDR